MSKKKLKFANLWVSATDIAREFGLSAIALNKLLVTEGLRDPENKVPTSKALEQNVARATPLKDGTPHFMWSKSAVRPIVLARHPRLSKQEVDFEEFIREILRLEKEVEEIGTDKGLRWFAEEESPKFQGLPENIVEAVCARRGVASRCAEFLLLIR